MGSSDDKLTALQRDVLHAFFERETGFFLTGGGALAGYYLRHRHTTDLDFFTTDQASFDRGRHVLHAVAETLGATLATVQEAPGFARRVLTRGQDAVVIDLVWDRVAQTYPNKPLIDGVRVDPLEEILVNKLTTIVSRGEERDLVDLFFLEKAGYRAEAALDAAFAKDGGCTPAVLAWLLSQMAIPDGVSLPEGCSAGELRAFVADLIRRLRRAAAP